MVLAKSESQCKIVHEHFSTRPMEVPTFAPKPLDEDVEVVEKRARKKTREKLAEAIVRVLGDGVERSAAEIIREVSKLMGGEVASSNVAERCRELVSKGIIESRGRFYPKYKTRQ